MLEFLVHLIPTAAILGVLIFVHELGHFLACRYAGVGVEKFSIGFGPELLGWKRHETRYSISLIPFGGYVKPKGESLEEVEARGGILDPTDFLAATPQRRFVILIAGVTMNFTLAYVLFVAMMCFGRPVLAPQIGGFVSGLPAETSALRIGDEVTSVNHKPVSSWQDLTMKILTSGGAPLNFTVKRGDENLEIQVIPQFEEGRDLFGQLTRVPRIGITWAENYIVEKYPLRVAVVKAAQLEWQLSTLTLQALGRLVTGELSPKTLIGPIGIVSIAGRAAQMGFAAVLEFTALLSVSLGVINALPIPALDGGHLFFLAIEVIRKKPLSTRTQERVTQVGFCFLMLLMAVVVFNDLVRIGVIDKIKTFLFL